MKGSMETIRCGVIGAGSMGTTHALNAETSGMAEITAVCSRRLKSAATLASRLDKKIPVYTNYRRMLDHEEIDALFICLPPGAHRGEVEDAAQRGIHLFLEKPLALDSEKAQRMVHITEKAGIVTQVDFQHRFQPVVQRLKTLIETGEAGIPSLMQAAYFCNALHASWWRQACLSGGQLLEQVIHLFDLFRYLLGPAAKVAGFRDNLCHSNCPDYSIEDTSAACLVMESGALVSLAASNCAVPGRWEAVFRLVCSCLVAEYSSIEAGKIRWTATDGRLPEVFEVEKYPRKKTLINFLEAIQRGKGAMIPIREAWEAQRIVHYLVRSILEERIVKL